MSKLGSVVAGLAMLAGASMSSTQAQAQHNWGGLYIGANIGYTWGTIDWQYANPAGAPGALSQSPSGASLGGHVGIQHQFVGTGIVLGLEAAYSGGLASKIEDSGADTPAFAGTFGARTRISDIFTVGPRLGYAPSRHWMLYVTGGYANAQTFTSDFLLSNNIDSFPGASRHSGWFVGGGVEYAVTHNWIAGLEYQHIDLDTRCQFRCELATPVAGGTRDITAEADVVRFRLSYKLGRPAPEAEPMK